MIDWVDRAEAMVAELREACAASAAAVIVLRYAVNDEAEYRLVYANERDPLARLKAHLQAGAEPLGLVVWSVAAEGGFRLGLRLYEGKEDRAEELRLYLSPPHYHPRTLACRVCGRRTTHLVEDQVRSPYACLHFLLVVVSLGFWLIVMAFSSKYRKRVACMACGTASVRRLPDRD